MWFVYYRNVAAVCSGNCGSLSCAADGNALHPHGGYSRHHRPVGTVLCVVLFIYCADKLTCLCICLQRERHESCHQNPWDGSQQGKTNLNQTIHTFLTKSTFTMTLNNLKCGDWCILMVKCLVINILSKSLVYFKASQNIIYNAFYSCNLA